MSFKPPSLAPASAPFEFYSGSGTMNAEMPESPQWVLYPDLSGGLNTQKDPHALDRNQLATSINVWLITNNAISKRPGNVPLITVSGATGSGAVGQTLSTAQFAGVTSILVQSNNIIYQAKTTDMAWNNIGTIATGGIMHTTDLYDPLQTSDCTFIVDGVDFPRIWKGPGSGALIAALAPNNQTGSALITPLYVDTLFSSLFYANDPTAPTAVYISDPFQPESFTANAITTTANINYNPTYIPYLVGRNDGVNGGSITGIKRFQNIMLVFKQGAVYALQQVGLFGDLVWAVTLVSASTGCVAPRSIVAFDTFVCFLGIDGVYMTDGTVVNRISDAVPTFFDGTIGVVPDIVVRSTAVGVRNGQRYLLFYDNGAGTTTPAGYPTIGMFFDWSKLDSAGRPTAGQIAGMNVNGAAPLRGPLDNGTIAWCDGSQDRVGNFPAQGVYADFGAPIATQIAGKADMMTDVWGDRAAISTKQVDNVRLLVSILNPVNGEVLTFNVYTVFDLIGLLASSVTTLATPATGGSAVVGTAVVGTAVIGLPPNAAVYQVASAYTQAPGQGKIVQVGFTETSIYAWTILGYVVTLNIQNVGSIGAP
jgi:hypothetical protein